MHSQAFEKIYVAGHLGMVGSAIVRQIEREGHKNLVTRSRDKLDLTNQTAVRDFFETEKPTQVYLAAAKVGGIHANNTYPAEFIYENLMIQNNVIHEAFKAGVKKLLFLGSSCIYPRDVEQPISEEALLTGKLELTNEPYAIAKIAGIKMCESYNRQYESTHGIDFRSIMPTNLYGPGDNYHPENSHVIPALIRRFHNAKIEKLSNVKIWGTGNARREFLFVEDMARAAIFIMNLEREKYQAISDMRQNHINIGYGEDVSIAELAEIIAEIVGYSGHIHFDKSKPDGMPRKLLNIKKMKQLGLKNKVSLVNGLNKTYEDFKRLNNN